MSIALIDLAQLPEGSQSSAIAILKAKVELYNLSYLPGLNQAHRKGADRNQFPKSWSWLGLFLTIHRPRSQQPEVGSS